MMIRDKKTPNVQHIMSLSSPYVRALPLLEMQGIFLKKFKKVTILEEAGAFSLKFGVQDMKLASNDKNQFLFQADLS